MDSIERLKIVLESIRIQHQGITNEQIALNLRYRTKGYLSDILNGSKPINTVFLDRIKTEYSVNPDWVLKGKGDMFFEKKADNSGKDYQNSRLDKKLKTPKKSIPFYDAEASAGITETEMTPIHAPAGTIDVGDLLHDSEAAIRIYGNSMNPNYPPGCVVGLLPCSSEYIEPGEVYVIETRDRRIVKRLFYKDDNADSTHLMCYSDNTMKFSGGARDGKLAYPPYYLPKIEIVRMFLVVGVIKRNSNSIIINRNNKP
jgi:hypothetical protein